MTLLIFNRDSDKMIFDRLQKEFEAARASQTEGSFKYNVLLFLFLFFWGGGGGGWNYRYYLALLHVFSWYHFLLSHQKLCLDVSCKSLLYFAFSACTPLFIAHSFSEFNSGLGMLVTEYFLLSTDCSWKLGICSAWCQPTAINCSFRLLNVLSFRLYFGQPNTAFCLTFFAHSSPPWNCILCVNL